MKYRHVSVRMSEELYDSARFLSFKLDKKLSEVIRRALIAYIARFKEPKPPISPVKLEGTDEDN